ncbi:Cytochrome c-type biogenesis protein CcmF [BD1-7 clade bacterium]|uniref:Cytochrome c-type biogenesis protein CcmF n=1 Tax=BD1-7 clade bacterium TaxID=2029982 RepID=A0A5S9QVB8_9GAMM|nr:Cytochrome c-type biogenesis protein CcmF [BD1-7 clade bacterium]
MLPEIAHFSLILGLCVAFALAVVPLLGTYIHDSTMMRSAKPLTVALFVFVALAYGLLVVSFIQDDFSVRVVQQHSNLSLPLIYKISAVWGGHEGSLLLWVLTLTLWMLAVAAFSKQLPDDMSARVLSVLGMVAIGFLLFSLLTSSPFERTFPNVPMDGGDLNPLLQDPGMAIHPPMLYFGYVGFSVAFAFAIAALLGGEFDAQWLRWTRPWTAAAWASLTLGIALGSWWAYYELGWGGWWFWDPVENASFMPWLVGTALMHSLAVSEKRGMFKSWTILLAIFAFSLSLLGTFLVRSGVLTSVHAFAADPTRGIFILAFLGVVVGGSLTLYALRAPTIGNKGTYTFFSREMFLLFNNILLVIAAITVLVGTLFPLIADLFELGKYSVGPPYFNNVFVPLMVALIIFMAPGSMMRWKQTRKEQLKPMFLFMVPVALGLGALVAFLYGSDFKPGAVAGFVLAMWLAAAIMFDFWDKLRHASSIGAGLRRLPLSFYGMQMAHIGLVVSALGIAVVSTYSQELDVRVNKGDNVVVEGYRFEFDNVRDVQGPNFDADEAKVRVFDEDEQITTLYPQKRYYHSQRGNVMTEAAIDATLGRDLFVAMGEQLDDNAWAMRVQYKPYLRLIWLGAILMALGGCIAVLDKRYR